MIYIYIIAAIVVLTAVIAAIVFFTKNKNTKPDSVDQVDFKSLNWTCGGTDGSKSKLSTVRISNLHVSPPTNMTMIWDKGMSIWGYSHDTPAGIACLFCKVGGNWLGGKFEWISTSRTGRDFKNIRASYANWKPIYLNATEFAFVVLSVDGKNRSNVIRFKK